MKIEDFQNDNKHDHYFEFLDYEVEVNLELEHGEKKDDFGLLVNNINAWSNSFFKHLEPMLYAYYENTLIMCGESEPIIESPSDIWRFMRIGSLMLHSNESEYYILASGWCAWEEEHGLEFDVNSSNEVVYLGSFINNGFYEDPKNPSPHNFIEGNA